MEREGKIRIPSGCAISGVISKEGNMINGNTIVQSIASMHERSNGLGGGFAGYGIYPEYAEYYAFHLFFDDNASKFKCEEYLNTMFVIKYSSEIPTRKNQLVVNVPLIWRYFVKPIAAKIAEGHDDEKEYVLKSVVNINHNINGAYCFSSGKNMGIFKGVGYPEDIGDFYKLDTYNGAYWTAHGRYPTNTPGWWGGAHPFGMLDFSVVHNGEISSYDANKRFIEMFGYKCDLLTDTEVITYMIDFLHRKKELTLEETAYVIAAPFWDQIEKMPKEKRELITYLRTAYSSLLITGPFSILVGFDNGIMALNDRLKLRSMVVGEKDDKVYIASEECAIRIMEPNLTKIWSPKGGEPVIIKMADRR